MANIWLDSFTDVDGTDLVDHVPEIGAGYTLNSGVAGNVEIQSNQLSLVTASSNTSEYILDGLSEADVRGSIILRRSGTGSVGFRYWNRWELSTGRRTTVEWSSGSGGLITLSVTGPGGEFTTTSKIFPWLADVDYLFSMSLRGKRTEVFVDGRRELHLDAPIVSPGTLIGIRLNRATTGSLVADSFSIDSIEGGIPMI